MRDINWTEDIQIANVRELSDMLEREGPELQWLLLQALRTKRSTFPPRTGGDTGGNVAEFLRSLSEVLWGFTTDQYDMPFYLDGKRRPANATDTIIPAIASLGNPYAREETKQ